MEYPNDPEGRLTVSAEYGQHVTLICCNHPEKEWSTKNIAPLGCRKIFYNLKWDTSMGEECDCPPSDLIIKE